MRYIDFYRMYGTRKLSEFFTPKVFNKSDIKLPRISTLYLFNIDTEIKTPKREGLLLKPSDIIVKTINNYNNDTIGNFREIPNKSLIYIKECKAIEPNINFLKNNAFILKADTLFIKNFYGLNTFYKYQANPLLPYWRFYNTFNTVILETNKELERNVFIPINIYSEIKFVNFKILMEKKITSGLLNRLPTYDLLIMFELWKLLDPRTKNESIFNKVNKDKIKNINFIFSSNTKCSIVNMEVLLSAIAEYREYNYKINKISYKTFIKLFYLMFKKIESSEPIINIESQKFVDDDNNDFIDEKALDKNIDEFEDDIPDEIHNDSDIEEDINNNVELINNNDIDNIEIEKEINSIEDIMKPVESKDKILKKIETLKSNGMISKNTENKFLEKLTLQDNIKISIGEKEKSIKEILEYKHDYTLKDEEIKIEKSKTVKNEDYLKNTMVESTKKYIRDDHEIMLIKTLMSISNSDVIVNNLEVTNEENILGKTVKYKLDISTLDNNKSTVEVIIPKVEENGTYKLSNNQYIMRRQRADLPIRKINFNEVVLSSYYGKLFVTRGTQKNNDFGYWIKNKLLKEYADGNIENFVVKNSKNNNYDIDLPEDYAKYGRYIKSFKYKNYTFNFNYNSRESLIDNDKKLLSKIEENGILIGKDNNDPIIMDFKNNIYVYKNNSFEYVGYMHEILSFIDTLKAPDEYINIKIFKTHIPLILLLCYYVGGLEKLLKLLKVNYYYEKHNIKVDKELFMEIKFNTEKLVIKKNKKFNFLLNGLNVISSVSKNLDKLNNKNDLDTLFNLLNYSLLVKNEIPNLNNMFIDPITMDLLKILKLPETFSGILIKAVEMLQNDNYKNPNKITGMSLKGYERMSGMLYKEISNSIRDYKNKSVFGRAKITMNPYNIIKRLNEDSTTMLVNDINPIANLKQYEDVTLLGFNGIGKESVNKERRQYDSDDIGILSEANKDSGDVGISAYVSASPNVVNTLGMVEETDIENKSWASIFSTSAMLAPFATNDDMKRVIFSGIQNEHVIPTLNMKIPYVRTPYDVMIASRLQDKYCQVAENNGEVIKVTDKVITIKYTTKDKTYNKDYKLYSWYSKIESNSTFKHELISNVVKGEKVKKDDVILYDKAFFTPDLYDKTRVVYIQSTLINVAFIDDIDTYEDSTTLSYEMSEFMSIEAIKLKSIPIEAKDNIIELIEIGNKVIPTTSLLTITNQILDLEGLDEESIEVLKSMNSFSPKAKYTGTIDDIVLYYNCDFEDLSPTLKELATISDKKLLETTGYTGRVNSSYSIKGKPLLEGNVEVRIFIKVKDDMSIADKMIWGNQMKCTVGGLFSSITTFDTNEKVDATFSFTSISKRIVLSMVKMGVLANIAKKVESNAIAMYFEK